MILLGKNRYVSRLKHSQLSYTQAGASHEALFWVCIACLCLLKYVLYGFEYYPVLDDYIQYWFYPNAQNIWKDIVLKIGLYNAHPISSLADPYVWGRFWQHMALALALITMMHAASAFLISKSLQKSGVSCGPLFGVVFLLLPLGFEATYWISASSRIVAGLFFVGLSLWCCTRYTACKKARWFWLFAIFGLVSFGFYEQVIIIGFLLTLLVVWRMRHQSPNKNVYFVPFVNLALVCAYYAAFSKSGAFGARSSLISPEMLWTHARYIWSNLYLAWGRGLVTLNINGFGRGLSLLLANRWYMVMVVLACLVTAYFGAGRWQKPDLKALWLAPLLFFAPYAPFFVLTGAMVPFRNTFTSFIGLGLVFILIFDLLVRTIWLRRAVLFVVIFVFMTVNVSERSDYRAVSMTDRKICEGIASKLDSDVLAGKREAVLVRAQWQYTPQNVHHHTHIYSVTQSDWSLTGALRCFSGSRKIKKITPVQELTPQLRSSGAQILRIDENLNITRMDE